MVATEAKQEGDNTCRRLTCSVWKNRDDHRNVGGISIRGETGAPSPKGCVVNGLKSKASSK